jgi:hypothetical protein
MGLHDRADVGGQSRVLVLTAQPASGGEVLHATESVSRRAESLLDRLPPPTEAAFGHPRAAATEFDGHLGLEQPPLIPGESPGARTGQIQTNRRAPAIRFKSDA